jgi:hypothetical protein
MLDGRARCPLEYSEERFASSSPTEKLHGQLLLIVWSTLFGPLLFLYRASFLSGVVLYILTQC